MTTLEPQYIYIFLVLPSLFGLTLVGEGIYKVFHDQWSGLINVVLGIIFISFVVVAYFMFSNFFSGRV